jgi:hypothetical protein
VSDAVVSAAQLEGEDRLQILSLEKNPVAEGGGKSRGLVERGLDGGLVDAGGEDLLEDFLHRRLYGESGKKEFIVYHEDKKDTEKKSDLHENKSLNAESQRRKRSQRKPLE